MRVGLREQKHELIAAVTRQHIHGAHLRGGDLCDLRHGIVAFGMPENIVDPLEIVCVEHEDAERTLVAHGGGKLTFGEFEKLAAVAQAGQVIGARQQLFARQQLLEFAVGRFQRFLYGTQFIF